MIDAIETGRFIELCKEQPNLAHREPDSWQTRYTAGERSAITRDLRQNGLRSRKIYGLRFWEVTK